MRRIWTLLALLVLTSATCGPGATPVAGPVEIIVGSSGDPGQQLLLVASARNLGGLPVRFRGERCGQSPLRNIRVWIKSPSGDTMYLNNPLDELHGCHSTIEELAPGATVERTVILDGRLYESSTSGPVPMPPGCYTVTFFFTWILDDYGSQLRIIEQPVEVEWPGP